MLQIRKELWMGRSLMYRKWVPIFLSKFMIIMIILKALLYILLYTLSEGGWYIHIYGWNLIPIISSLKTNILLDWAGLGWWVERREYEWYLNHSSLCLCTSDKTQWMHQYWVVLFKMENWFSIEILIFPNHFISWTIYYTIYPRA